MFMFLETFDALEIVLGTEKEPALDDTDESRAAHERFHTRFRQAMSALRYSCTHEVLFMLPTGIRDPVETWRLLRDKHDTAATLQCRLMLLETAAPAKRAGTRFLRPPGRRSRPAPGHRRKNHGHPPDQMLA